MTVTNRLAGPAEQRLATLFHDGEWPTERVLLRRRLDRNPFMAANILLTLERCGTIDPSLGPLMKAAREHLAAYLAGHRAYHWPVRGGRSAMANAAALWRHRYVEISPDADCTCLVQLARPDATLVDATVQDLAFYRVDGARFRLPGFQRSLPAHGTFLTWFPEAERLHAGKIETVDVGADANILWYLAANRRLDAPGAAETIAFVADVVRANLVLRSPFRVSMYYPGPAVLLFLITRAAVWGDIAPLLALRQELLAQLVRCPVRSALESLCRAAALRLWKAPGAPAAALPVPDGRGAFYVGPLLAWPLQRFAPLEWLAARSFTHIRFRCEALEWALYLFLT